MPQRRQLLTWSNKSLVRVARVLPRPPRPTPIFCRCAASSFAFRSIWAVACTKQAVTAVKSWVCSKASSTLHCARKPYCKTCFNTLLPSMSCHIWLVRCRHCPCCCSRPYVLGKTLLDNLNLFCCLFSELVLLIPYALAKCLQLCSPICFSQASGHLCSVLFDCICQS